MHCTPQSNHDLPAHQPPLNIDVDINKDAQEPHPEYQNHPQNPDKVGKEKITYHPLINGMLFFFIHQNLPDHHPTGLPCDAQGNFLPEGAPPPPWDKQEDDDYATFKDSAAFKLTDLLV